MMIRSGNKCGEAKGMSSKEVAEPEMSEKEGGQESSPIVITHTNTSRRNWLEQDFSTQLKHSSI
jgi:hypothetical protein